MSPSTRSHRAKRTGAKSVRPKRNRTRVSYMESSEEDNAYFSEDVKGSISSPKHSDVYKLEHESESAVADEAHIIPPWQNLPYHILFDIFIYAVRMREEDGDDPTHWLLASAYVCKDFAEAALSVLYYAPPLGTPERVRGFLSRMQDEPGTGFMKYSSKVKYIDMEAIPALTRKDNGRDPVELVELISVAPQLHGLAVEVYGDRPSHKRNVVNLTGKAKSVVYKPELFEMLESRHIYLKGFKWNYYFNRNQDWPWNSLAEIHSTSILSLEDLEIVWLNSFTKSSSKLKQAEQLVEAIKALPKLKNLTFTLCNLFDKEFNILAQLPDTLKSLNITDCSELDSERLCAFLAPRGGNLKHLALNHNRSLDLGFLNALALKCPKLESLLLDLHCYGSSITTFDQDPSFQCLLPPGTDLTWPSTLKSIKFNYLRKWGSEEAARFFKSLVESAETLPDLRNLVIKATVEMEWRDRVKFRNYWIGRLERVFKCPSLEPAPLTSIAMHYAKTSGKVNKPEPVSQLNGVKKYGELESSDDEPILKCQKRVAEKSAKDKPTISTPRETRQEHRALGKPLSRRDRKRRWLQSSESETPSGATRGAKARKLNADSEVEPGLFIQGKCSIVDIRIENLRPMETQYRERDFIDDEVSGDEEWTGNDAYDSAVDRRFVW